MVILSVSPCVQVLSTWQQFLVVVVLVVLVVLDELLSPVQRESIVKEARVCPIVLSLQFCDLEKTTGRVVVSFDIKPRL